MAFSGYLIIFISILIFIAFDWGVKKAVYSKDYDSRIITQARVFFVVWYILINWAGTYGWVRNFESFPPPIVYLVVSVVLVSLILAFTKIGEALTQLDWPYLIGFHGIRVLSEIALYCAYIENLAPVQMTFYGLNFNILSGITALLLIPSLNNRARLGVIKLWNFVSLCLLLGVLAIGFLSFPSELQFFMATSDNTWITTVPYIYMPGILLFFGLFGHWVIFRKIKSYSY